MASVLSFRLKGDDLRKRSRRMNWTWNVRSRDGAMNGLEFARCTAAGGFTRVLVHTAPAQASVEVIADDGKVIAREDIDRDGNYSPMTLMVLGGEHIRRSEVWPDENLYGLTRVACWRRGRHSPGVAARS